MPLERAVSLNKILNTMNNTEKREHTILSYINNATDIYRETYLNSEIINYQRDNFFYTLFFKGKRTKPTCINKAGTEEYRKVFINRLKESLLKENENEKRFIQNQKLESDKIQKDSILYADWGYEQTNINFYLVIERRNSKIILQEIGQQRSYERQDSGTCTPNIQALKGEPFERRLTKYASVKINEVQSASIYSGKPLYWSSYY